MRTLPLEIQTEVIRWQRVLRWPELVPAWAEIPDADGNMLWHRYQDLTVALCEQATEFHVRQGRKRVEKWVKRPTTRMARLVARDVLWARIYRCRFIQLTGMSDATEADMPFAFMGWPSD